MSNGATSALDAALMESAEPVGHAAANFVDVAGDSAKRRQILDGARKVFLADGFDGASMNEIARTANVSKGTLYVYFDSKVALFEGLIRADRKQQAEQLFITREAEHGEDADLRSVLIRFGGNFARIITQGTCIAHTRTVVAVAQKFPQIGRAFYEAGPMVGQSRLTTFLSGEVGKGTLVIDQLSVAANQLTELWMAGIYKRVLFCVVEKLSDAEIAETVTRGVDVFLAAYGVKTSV